MNITKQVKQLLTTNPEMRDNPKKLIRRALQNAYGINVLSAMIIAEYYKNVSPILCPLALHNLVEFYEMLW